MKECTCSDWKENIPKLNAILTMAQLRNSSGYTGKFFQYCPWCGKKDSVEESKEKDDHSSSK